MEVRIIHKKIHPEYFTLVEEGKKNFEIRKDEDGIEAGDYIVLHEYVGNEYTGREITKEVDYVMRDKPEYGLEKGYCIISFKHKDFLSIKNKVIEMIALTDVAHITNFGPMQKMEIADKVISQFSDVFGGNINANAILIGNKAKEIAKSKLINKSEKEK